MGQNPIKLFIYLAIFDDIQLINLIFNYLKTDCYKNFFI